MLERLSINLEEENNAEIKTLMNKVSTRITKYVPGDYLMTDDKAPVVLLGMKVIDELIRDEVAYYKDIYREGGVKALLVEQYGSLENYKEYLSFGFTNIFRKK